MKICQAVLDTLQDLPELRPLAREASLELVEVGRRLASAVDWRCSQAGSSICCVCECQLSNHFSRYVTKCSEAAI